MKITSRRRHRRQAYCLSFLFEHRSQADDELAFEVTPADIGRFIFSPVSEAGFLYAAKVVNFVVVWVPFGSLSAGG